jgi:hypothetical protein
VAEAAIDRSLLGTILTRQVLAKKIMARRQGLVAIDPVAAFQSRCLELRV